jgi:hypothetical protein
MRFFENYDDFSIKGKLTDAEIKRMAKANFTDKIEDRGNTAFSHKFFNTPDNGNLNIAMSNSTYNKMDYDGRLHMIEKELKKKVPFLHNAEIKYTQDHPANGTFNLRFEKTNSNAVSNEKGLTFDADFSLSIRLNYKDDDIMDVKKNTYKILLSTSITTSDDSINRANRYDENGKSGFSEMLSKMVNASDDQVDDLINSIGEFMYGSPDKQDANFAKQNQLNVDGIKPEDLMHLVPEIKNRISRYVAYMYYKYDINIV